MAQKAETLVEGERQWAPLVWLIYASCLVADCVLLWMSWSVGGFVGWAICLAACLALTASNTAFLVQHRRTTVGMAPVSAASLMPASASVVMCADAPFPARVAAIVLLAISSGITLLVVVSMMRLRRAYAHAPQPDPDAVVIVLGGSVRKGQPCHTLMVRLDVAESVWRDSPARTLVLTGGPVPGEDDTEAAAMERVLRGRGIPDTSLILEPNARNTRENIAFSCEAIPPELASRQLCVLTSDSHMYRALAAGRAVGQDLVPIPAPTPAASRLQQWCREVVTVLAGV